MLSDVLTRAIRQVVLLVAVSAAFLVVPSLSPPQEPDTRDAIYQLIAQMRLNNPTWKYEEEVNRLVEKSPHEFTRALVTFIIKEVREDIPGKESALSKMVSLLSLVQQVRNLGLLRAELVKYLEVDERGRLRGEKVLHSPAGAAYFILRFIDTQEGCRTVDKVFMFQAIAGDQPGGYTEILKRFGNDLPEPLVEYLNSEFPESYVWRAMNDVYNQSGIHILDFDLAHHIIETTAWRIQRGHRDIAQTELAEKQIKLLTEDKAWYSRRYVVHVLLKYPFFRTPELVKKLQNDPHPLVRERAKHIKLDPAQQK